MSRLISVLLLLFFTLPLDHTWLIHDRTSVKLNFTFFCVPRYKLLLYITSKVVSDVTKSSVSDDLLHINCNVTNQTQICFRSMQVVDCLPVCGYSVIPKALLFLCCYCWKSASHIHLSFILFQVFCSLLWCFLHRRKYYWLQIPLWYAVFNKVCEIHSVKCSLYKWAWWGAASKSSHLKCTNLIHFHLTAGQFHRNSCIVMFWDACELLQFAATQ